VSDQETAKPEVTWRDARRAIALAAALVVLLLVAGANFVVVEVRLLGLSVGTRMSWALIGAAALGFGAGVIYARRLKR
jgi:hypothetical protein